MKRKLVLSVLVHLAVICVATFALPGRCDVFFEDRSFSYANWTSTVRTHGNGGGGAEVQWSGGSFLLSLSVNGNNPVDDYSQVVVYFERNGFTYNPATQGYISSIDYVEEDEVFNGSAKQITSLAIRQNGIIYVAALEATPFWFEVNEPIWTSHRGRFYSWDFFKLNPEQCTDPNDFTISDPNNYPDFSSTGAPISFGFIRASTSAVGQQSSFGTNTVIDLWSVNIHSNPLQGGDLLVTGIGSVPDGMGSYKLASPLYRVDRSGSVFALAPPFSTGDLSGMTFGQDGNIYARDFVLERFSGVTGSYIDNPSDGGGTGSVTTGGVALGATGKIYWVSAYPGVIATLSIFDPSDPFHWGRTGIYDGSSGSAVFNDLIFGADGKLYTDATGYLIRYDPTQGSNNYEFLANDLPLVAPEMRLAGGYLYLVDVVNRQVLRYKDNGSSTWTRELLLPPGSFDSTGGGSADWRPVGLEFGEDGRLYVSTSNDSAGTGEIVRFDIAAYNASGASLTAEHYATTFPASPLDPSYNPAGSYLLLVRGSVTAASLPPDGSISVAPTTNTQLSGNVTFDAGVTSGQVSIVPFVETAAPIPDAQLYKVDGTSAYYPAYFDVTVTPGMHIANEKLCIAYNPTTNKNPKILHYVNGAFVELASWTEIDPNDPTKHLVCAYTPSDSLFAVVQKLDVTAPSISVPNDIATTATSASGAPVSYTVSATDDVDGSVSVLASPASGSVFSLGTTTVTCTASDSSGNTATKTFNVTVSYDWSGVLQPINADGSSVFKAGSTVPVKFQLTGASAGITNAVANLTYTVVGSNSSSVNEAVSTAASDSGNQFRYDSVSKQYVFNMKTTKDMAGQKLLLSIDLHDGVSRTVQIGLK